MSPRILPAVAMCVLCVPQHVVAAFFTPLGRLPGDDISSAADVSADGSVVVGYSAVMHIGWGLPTSFDLEAFRWTRDGGMVGLGYAPGDQGSAAHGVSADGSVVVGSSFVGYSADAFRWTNDGGMVLLSLPLSEDSAALATSADGSIVVGRSYHGLTPGGAAFRWTNAGGMVDLGDLPGGQVSTGANDVSADGSVVVGFSSSGNNSPRAEAFRWTSADGMIGLGNLPGFGFESRAEAVSADGSVIVGSSSAGDFPVAGEAFRWTRDSGMVGLGDLPGGHHRSSATDVSADGSIVVGLGHSENGQEAFVWSATHGIRPVSDVLTDLGIDFAGWTLTSATAISADGTTIVGNGINALGQPEAWLANLSAVPEPSAAAPTLVALAALVGSRQAANSRRRRTASSGSRRRLPRSAGFFRKKLSVFCSLVPSR